VVVGEMAARSAHRLVVLDGREERDAGLEGDSVGDEVRHAGSVAAG
jgi:hypothetical protein